MKPSKKSFIFLAILIVLNIAAYFFINSNSSSGGSSLTSVDLSTASLETYDGDKLRLTVPADYVYGATQSDLDKVAQEAGYESVTLNEDGTATYILTEDQHKEMISNLSKGLSESINGLPGNSPFKKVTEIKFDEEFKSYEVYTSLTNADFDSSMIVMNLKMFSTMYYAFNGIQDQPLHFDFYNKNNELIATLDSNISQ